MEEQRKSCPCEFNNPCTPHCSCARPFMSGGCRRCCKYGSKEQQAGMAKYLLAQEDAFNKAIEALSAISKIGSLISDGRLIAKTGKDSDAAYRGQMYVSARKIAKEALSTIEKAEVGRYVPKAPEGCVIDDNGEVIKGTWTHKNGGHGDFWWRFDADEVANDNDD